MTSSPVKVEKRAARRGGSRFNFWSIISISALAIMLLLLIYPLVRLLGASLFGSDSASPWWEPYAHLFTRKLYYQSLINSFILAGSATVGAMLIGVPLAYFVNRLAIPGKIVIRSAVVLTFVSPPFIGAYAWIIMFGQNGVVRRALGDIGISVPSIYGWLGTILVLTLQGMPYVFLFVSSGLKTVDQSVEDAGVNLGVPRLKVALNVILPLIKPALSTSAMLVFVTAFADIGTPMVIGQNLRVYPRLVYQSFVGETSNDYRLASSLAIVMLVVTIAALLIQRGYAKRNSFGQSMVRPLGVQTVSPLAKWSATAYVYLIVGLACIPLFVVVVSSFLQFSGSTMTGQLTLENYTSKPGLGTTLGNTLLVSTVATLLCVVIGTLVGYVVVRKPGRISASLDIFSMVPFAVSGVVFGIAFSLAFSGSPFFLSGTLTILVLAYFIRRLPFSVRSASSQLSQMGTQTEEASVNLGVPPGRTFLKITAPMLLPAVASGALLTWATVVKEFNATIILYGPWSRTMSVQIFQEISSGNFQYASALGTILVMLALVPIVILFAVSKGDEEILI
ncbi:MAG: iron ABC transporter permease [Scrofimicrobium sp.]